MPLPHGFRDWLTKESQRWHEHGLLQPDQRERILALYPEEEGGSGRLAFALRTLGVLLLGAAVLLVISHNWADLSRAGRLATVIIALIGLQGTGLWYSLRAKATGSVLGHLAGCIMFGAAIALTGQIYHLDAHSPDAVLAWCLGTMPFALLLDSALLHVATVALAGTWLVMETGEGSFGYRSAHLEAYRIAFYALLVPTALAAYRNPRPVLAGAVAWACGFAWFQFWGKLPAELFVLPLAIAALHAPGDPRARGWRFIGGLGVTIITIILGELEVGRSGDILRLEPVMTTLVAAVAGLAIYRSLQQKDPRRNWPAVIALATLALCLLNNSAAANDTFALTLIKAGANAATIALAIWLLRLGLAEGRLRPYVYGSLVFLSWLIVRYVDIGRSLSMLTLAGFFAVIGLILFVLARVWRSQKEAPEPEAMEPFAPAWLTGLTEAVRPHARGLLATAAVLQVLVIGWMVYHHQQPLRSGERFLLRCQPVDPRDLLKGDYVILSYDFERFTEQDIKRLNAEWKQLNPGNAGVENTREYGLVVPNDTTVYVSLKKSAGGVAETGDVTLLRPKSGAYLRGLVGRGNWAANSARFGVEAFYVTEGAGHEWESLRNQGRLLAEVGVLPDGRAGLVGLKKAEATEAVAVPFRKLEHYFLAKQDRNLRDLRVIQDTPTFDKAYQPAQGSGRTPTPPDFSKEIVVSYALPPTLKNKEVSFDKMERRDRVLVVTVKETDGEARAFTSTPQVAAKVDRGDFRTVEIRDMRGILIRRIDL